MKRQTTRLRELINAGPTLFVPGCFNAMSARVLENVGFPAIYMSGYGTSLSLTGLPDAGLVTMTEVITNARYIAQAVNVPVIADADNGYGNAINVIRTVREFIGAGIAGIHLEDQVSPKRCGHVAGRLVVPIEEAVGKMRAADATRKELDPDFLLIARTDARGASGGSLDEAIRRANALLAAGADLAFVEGPTSVEEVRRVCSEVKGPVFYNMTGVSPRYTLDEMKALGIAVTIAPGALMRVSLTAMHDLAVQMRDEGPMAEAANLRGINTIMLDFFDDPAFVRDLFEFVVEMELRFAKAQVQAGVDLIGVGDAAASLIGPQLYEEFVWPYEKKLVDGLHALGTRARLHICGNTRFALKGMGRLGCDIVDLDFLSPVAEGRAQMGPNQVILGNINPVAVVRAGKPHDIFQAIAACHRDAGPRFIIGPGCEIPRDTPHENVQVFAQYARASL